MHSEKCLKSHDKTVLRCRFREGTYIIWLSCKLLMSVEVDLVDCDIAECSVLARRPVPSNPFRSLFKFGILWASLVCASKTQKCNVLIWVAL